MGEFFYASMCLRTSHWIQEKILWIFKQALLYLVCGPTGGQSGWPGGLHEYVDSFKAPWPKLPWVDCRAIVSSLLTNYTCSNTLTRTHFPHLEATPPVRNLRFGVLVKFKPPAGWGDSNNPPQVWGRSTTCIRASFTWKLRSRKKAQNSTGVSYSIAFLNT